MDGITTLDAIIIYSVLISPLLSMVLLFFWMSANMKSTAKAQLLGIVILMVLGFLAINSPFILIIEAAALILLVIWIIAYGGFFPKERLPVFLCTFALQIAFYIFFTTILILLNLGSPLAFLICVIPILSMILLYPWTFGNKKKSEGRVFIMIIFIVQIIFTILNILISSPATF